MPWEKSFIEDEAVGKAMELFWEKGYEPASISDLIEATGVNRGSLYNAFGGKQQLFVRAIRKYECDNSQKAISQLEALDSPVQAIHQLFGAIIEETIEDKERKGCFLINTASELGTHEDEVKSIVIKGLGRVEAFLRRSIEVAQARGEVAASIDAPATAKALFALIVGIRVLGRGAFDREALDLIADQAKRLLED